MIELLLVDNRRNDLCNSIAAKKGTSFTFKYRRNALLLADVYIIMKETKQKIQKKSRKSKFLSPSQVRWLEMQIQETSKSQVQRQI